MGLREQIDFDPEYAAYKISSFMKESANRFQTNGAIIGLSGGIDSACVCGLSVMALGASNVFGLIMPDQDSDPKSEEDAKLVAQTYGIRTKTIDITPVLDAFGIYDIIPKDTFSKRDKVAKLVKFGYSLFPKSFSPFIGGLKGTKFNWQRKIQAYYRIKHRVRMVYLYYYGEQLNYLVMGTANRTENLTGFFVKYGDSAADIMPILNLYKTQIRRLSEFIGVPKLVIEKPSVPDLIPGIEDELALGLSYEKLDLILVGLNGGLKESEIAKELGTNGRLINYVKKLVNLSECMRGPPGVPDA
ncbi:MAG: NAD(+) synthase [bacterium]|nr:NAD(+) synthase [bacterium]